MSDQKTIEFTASTEIPRRPASRPNNQAPVANPMAMNTPWGEKPNTRSTTGQPTEASDGLIGPSVTACSRATAGPEPRDRASEEQPARHVARVVHAQRDSRRANDHVQRCERRAVRDAGEGAIRLLAAVAVHQREELPVHVGAVLALHRTEPDRAGARHKRTRPREPRHAHGGG